MKSSFCLFVYMKIIPQHRTPTQVRTKGTTMNFMEECPDPGEPVLWLDCIGRETISVSVTKRSGIDELPTKARVPALSIVGLFDMLDALEVLTLLKR